MGRHIPSLVKVRTNTPDGIRKYGRTADEMLGDLATELQARRHEVIKKIIALLKHAEKEGVVNRSATKWARATRITAGYLEAAILVRLARRSIRRVYPLLDSLAGEEIHQLRVIKYGESYKGKKEPETIEV